MSVQHTSSAQRNIGNLVIKNKYKADHYYLDYYYEQAIVYYKLALKNDSNKDAIRLKIGNSYRMLQDYESALYWYEQVLKNDSVEVKPIDKLNYANTLMTQEKYDEALIWFEIYQKEAPEDTRSENRINGLYNLDSYSLDSLNTYVSTLPINTMFSENAPVFQNNGIVFLSSRRDAASVDLDYMREEDLYNLYHVFKDSVSGWDEVALFDKVLNTPFHEGPVSFYSGEDKLLLTRSNYLDKHQIKDSKGKTQLQLYTAIKTGELWANIQPFELNDPEYSLAHPALNATNDTLYFVSNMKGGFGGTDLYMTVYSDGWGTPVNLGPKVNTEGNEMFPSYVSDRLFFSSDGLDGLGGLDVYKAKIKSGDVKSVTNIGKPINSAMDDFSYIIDPDSKTGYFASNRMGGEGGDDIYSFKQNAQALQGIAIQEQDRSPLSGVYIDLIKDGLVIASTITGEDGTFKFNLLISSDFEIIARKEEHSFRTEVKLTTKGNRVDLDTLLIEMYKHDFFARGLIYDNETQREMHDVQVIIKDLESLKMDTTTTGPNGRYNFIIEPGKNYQIHAAKERFTSDSLLINTLSISKGVITNDFLLEEEYIEKEIVFFDYNEDDLKPEAIPLLNKILEVVRRYPDDWLIIGAHADARGRKEYNQDLSDRRAKSVLDYFVSRGVSPQKIIARGFGEGLIINRCSDGVNCREEDHSKNRRAEILVEQKLPEEELEFNNH